MSKNNIAKLEIMKGIADQEHFFCSGKNKKVKAVLCSKKDCKQYEKNQNDSYCSKHSISYIPSNNPIIIETKKEENEHRGINKKNRRAS